MIAAEKTPHAIFTQKLVGRFVSELEKRTRSPNALHPINDISVPKFQIAFHEMAAVGVLQLVPSIFIWMRHADRLLSKAMQPLLAHALQSYRALKRTFFEKVQACGSNIRPAHDSGWYIHKGLPHGLPIF